jgi:two-component system cell cycle response regulator DivK
MTGVVTAVVLAVEDEPRNMALLRAIVRPPRYDLHVVPSLAEARRWLRRDTPAIVLLDRRLPDGDGLELMVDLRGTPATAACPVVLVSASALPSDRIAADVAGCDAFIAKPIGVSTLLDEMARQIERRRSSREAGW